MTVERSRRLQGTVLNKAGSFAKVDELMAFVDQLETQLAICRATAANLLEALVAELSDSSPQKYES
jgi:hypothetical protein